LVVSKLLSYCRIENHRWGSVSRFYLPFFCLAFCNSFSSIKTSISANWRDHALNFLSSLTDSGFFTRGSKINHSVFVRFLLKAATCILESCILVKTPKSLASFAAFYKILSISCAHILLLPFFISSSESLLAFLPPSSFHQDSTLTLYQHWV
jgi:hypothetical protein